MKKSFGVKKGGGWNTSKNAAPRYDNQKQVYKNAAAYWSKPPPKHLLTYLCPLFCGLTCLSSCVAF